MKVPLREHEWAEEQPDISEFGDIKYIHALYFYKNGKAMWSDHRDKKGRPIPCRCQRFKRKDYPSIPDKPRWFGD